MRRDFTAEGAEVAEGRRDGFDTFPTPARARGRGEGLQLLPASHRIVWGNASPSRIRTAGVSTTGKSTVSSARSNCPTTAFQLCMKVARSAWVMLSAEIPASLHRTPSARDPERVKITARRHEVTLRYVHARRFDTGFEEIHPFRTQNSIPVSIAHAGNHQPVIPNRHHDTERNRIVDTT